MSSSSVPGPESLAHRLSLAVNDKMPDNDSKGVSPYQGVTGFL